MKYSSSCEKTCVPVSMEVFQGMREFFRFVIPFNCNDLVNSLVCAQLPFEL